MPSVITTVAASTLSTISNGKLKLVNPNYLACRATQLEPRYDLLTDDEEPLAIDIEFQNWKERDEKGELGGKWIPPVGRIAVVNTKGETVYDVYAKYPFDPDIGTMMPPKEFMVAREDLKTVNGAQPIHVIEAHLERIMRGRTIIGTGMSNDLRALNSKLWQMAKSVVDIQTIYNKVALSTLALRDFGMDIQGEGHKSTEDAAATMFLYLKHNPYKGHGYQAAPKVEDADDFPALGAPLEKKK